MSKDTRIPCYIIGQGTTVGGKIVYNNYCALPLRPFFGPVDTFGIHAKDGERRRGSGEYFHASRYGIPSKISVLTNEGIMRFSGFYPGSFREAGAKTQGTAWTVANGRQAFLCWISYTGAQPGYKNRCVCAWVYDAYDAKFLDDGSIEYTMHLEQWTGRTYYCNYNDMPDIYGLTVDLLGNHDAKNYWTKKQTRDAKHVQYILDKITVHPSTKNFSMMDYTHNEWDAYQWFKLGRSLGDYGLMPNWYRSGFATAFVNAVASIPQSSVNGLEAILDLCDLAVTLKNPIKGLKSAIRATKRIRPGDVWLKYRYVFKTTEMDLNSIKDLSDRIDVLRSLCTPVKLRGLYTEDDALFRCKASFNLPAEQLELLDSIPSYMGGSISAADLWDVIPWSFMVDWVLHVSDLLESLESWGTAQEAQYQMSDVWYSVETSIRDQKVYFRIPGDPVRPMTGAPHLVTRRASSKTIMMRVTDCLAIFGRK